MDSTTIKPKPPESRAMSDLLAYIINPSPETLERQERMWREHPWALTSLAALVIIGAFIITGAM